MMPIAVGPVAVCQAFGGTVRVRQARAVYSNRAGRSTAAEHKIAKIYKTIC